MNLITHVAIRFNGRIYSLPAPNRHHNVIWKIAEDTRVKTVDAHGDDQGFLDSTGKYLTRKEALDIAVTNGQLKNADVILHDQLYSEDLW